MKYMIIDLLDKSKAAKAALIKLHDNTA